MQARHDDHERSSHMPMLTISETTKSIATLCRIAVIQRNCGVITLHASTPSTAARTARSCGS